MKLPKQLGCLEKRRELPGGVRGHRRSQGVQWVHVHHQGGKKNFRPNLEGKCESAPPQPEQESIFRTVFAWWLRFGGIFRRSLRGRRLKRGQLFLGKKVHPPDKILATPMSGAEPGRRWYVCSKLGSSQCIWAPTSRGKGYTCPPGSVVKCFVH